MVLSDLPFGTNAGLHRQSTDDPLIDVCRRLNSSGVGCLRKALANDIDGELFRIEDVFPGIFRTSRGNGECYADHWWVVRDLYK